VQQYLLRVYNAGKLRGAQSSVDIFYHDLCFELKVKRTPGENFSRENCRTFLLRALTHHTTSAKEYSVTTRYSVSRGLAFLASGS
jgi:hypothetical protein